MAGSQLNLGFNTPVTPHSKDEWLTPQFIVQALGAFDLDPCAPVNRPWDTARTHYTGSAYQWNENSISRNP
jgi:hypothetical protein